jgi:ABC-2 type transport system permease protein
MSKNIKNRNHQIRNHSIRMLFVSIVIVIAVNMLGSKFFTRIDLTAEKRFTLTKATRQLITDLDDYVHFQVYLEGDFPAGFKRLRNNTREMLDEFRAYSELISYEFINPTQQGNWEVTEENYKMLTRKGLQPTQLQVKSEDASSQQIIFPGAIVSYKGRELPLSLLHDQMGASSENIINNSSQALEYNLASVIHRLTTDQKPRVAFMEGHGELEFEEVADIIYQLQDFYEVGTVAVRGEPTALDGISTLVVAQPLRAFSEPDKFIIDQFIMNGGKVLWLIDPVFASMDSLQGARETMGMAWPVNLDDLLFRYGVRLNSDLLMDMKAAPIPITTGYMGERPQISLLPWFYFPLVGAATNHPVVRNLNAVRTEFVSSVDTVETPGIKKTFLLQTSPYTRVVQAPAVISFEILQRPAHESQFSAGAKPVAVLLEGEFPSLYTNRQSPVENLPAGFERRNHSRKNAMIVVADGDMIRNKFDNRGQPLPLGYDRYLDQTFGNADFILNAINYLNDDRGIMDSRNREIRLRLLDQNRISKNRFLVQMTNVALPVLLLIVFGLIRFFMRKKKYSRRRN